MANWMKNSFLLVPDMAYIMPSPQGKGVAIYCGDEMCIIEGIDVQECLDKLKTFDDEITFKERIDMIS
jgi:hypothetical protein